MAVVVTLLPKMTLKAGLDIIPQSQAQRGVSSLSITKFSLDCVFHVNHPFVYANPEATF